MSINTYKKIVAGLVIISLYLLFNLIYVAKNKIEPNVSSFEIVDDSDHQTNLTSENGIINLSLCDLDTSLLNSPEVNSTLITPMFLNASVIIPGVRIKVNERELRYLKEHKSNSLKGGLCALGAWEGIIGTSNSGFYNNKADALRHAFWAACATALTSPTEAQEMLDNHENGGGDPMDNYNNKKGVKIGRALKRANPGGVTNSQIWRAVELAFEKGELYCSKCSPPIIPGSQKPKHKPQPTPSEITPPVVDQQPQENHDNRVDRNHVGGQNQSDGTSRGSDHSDGIAKPNDGVPRGGNNNDGIAKPNDGVPRGGERDPDRTGLL